MIRLGKGVTLSNEEVEVLKELLGKISLEVNIDCQNVQNSFPIQPNKPLGDRQKPFKVLSMRLIKTPLLPLIGYAFNCKSRTAIIGKSNNADTDLCVCCVQKQPTCTHRHACEQVATMEPRINARSTRIIKGGRGKRITPQPLLIRQAVNVNCSRRSRTVQEQIE